MPGQRVLLLYATRQGQTEKVAARLAGHFRSAAAEVRLVNARDREAAREIDPADFDLLVFGGSLHAGGIEKEILEWINARAPGITPKPRSFFLVLLSAATRERAAREHALADARQKLDEQLDIEFDDVEMIAGALRYSKYSWPLKWLMRRIAKQQGGDTDTSRDYEYTDWQQVEAYAERLLARIP